MNVDDLAIGTIGTTTCADLADINSDYQQLSGFRQRGLRRAAEPVIVLKQSLLRLRYTTRRQAATGLTCSQPYKEAAGPSSPSQSMTIPETLPGRRLQQSTSEAPAAGPTAASGPYDLASTGGGNASATPNPSTPASAPPEAATAAATADGNAASTGTEDSPDTYEACPIPETLTGADPAPKSHIFDQLSKEETDAITYFMIDNLGLFNDSGHARAELTDDVLTTMELFPPLKAPALAYMDGSGPKPDRFAIAIVLRGSIPDVQEYLVGPLPLSDASDIIPLHADGAIPFIKRPISAGAAQLFEPVVMDAAYTLRDVFKNATGGACYGSGWNGTAKDTESCSGTAATFIFGGNPTLTHNTSQRVTTITFNLQPDGDGSDASELFPVPITFKVLETGLDNTLWETFDFVYCNQGPFESPEDLLDAWEAGDLDICSAPMWASPGLDYSWATTTPRTNPSDASGKSGPRTYMPQGNRFTLDDPDAVTGWVVAWQSWTAHVSMRGGSGITLHDIAYNGSRIVYELAFQDLMVAYSGYGGFGQTMYADTYFGIGLATEPLRRGYDCPLYAAYVNALINFGESGPLTLADAICMYEEDAGTTSWRHTNSDGKQGPHLDAMRKLDFVIRSVATVGNYDYVFEIRLHQDGSIDVNNQLAGYMTSQFRQPGSEPFLESPFGVQVQQYVVAGLHDHMMNWKVDLDVTGINNTFVVSDVTAGSYVDAFQAAGINASKPGWHEWDILKYIRTSQPGKEVGLNVDSSKPSMWMFSSMETNAWGNNKSYAIIPGNTIPQLLPHWHPYTKAGAWTKYNIAVTQQKDSEPRSVSWGTYDIYNPQDPVWSLDNFLNGESTDDKDLVAWVTIGALHVPRSEDVPVINNFGVGFSIQPRNYFDSLASMTLATDTDAYSACADTSSDEDLTWSLAGPQLPTSS
ncbi:hypothetical protein WJX74_006497 [Apatococcus lobatus]|uniref:Amine oxidase n=1 Tax=Apatococcus lobatus TaxID=904363 RepID=A0AAW1SH27_9CHLO